MERARRRIGWIGLLIVGVLVAAAGSYVLIVPIDPADFGAATGTTWATFAAQQPDAAAYLEREARLLAVGFLGFGVLVAGISWTLRTAPDRRLVAVMVTAPVTLGAAATVFLVDGAVGLGAFYAVVALLAALALVTIGGATESASGATSRGRSEPSSGVHPATSAPSPDRG
jgi:hypothetical protein